jgi:hypothetical protein
LEWRKPGFYEILRVYKAVYDLKWKRQKYSTYIRKHREQTPEDDGVKSVRGGTYV